MNKQLSSLLLTLVIVLSSMLAHATDTLSVNLQQADKSFIEHNFMLLANQYNIGINEALTIQARVYPNPTLLADFNTWDPENKQLFFVGPTGEKDFALSQLFILGGKRKTQIDIAKQNVDLARYDFEDLVRNLKFQLHSSLNKIAQYEIVLKKYDIQLQLIDSIINNYEYQTKRGNIPTKEVVRLKSVYFEINSDRSEIASNLSDEMNNVRTLMGVTSFVHPIIDESKLDKLTVNTSEKIVEDALQNRPDLKSSKILQTTSQLNLKLQKLMNVPDLTYIASYDQHGGAFDKQFNSGFSFNLPTWNLNRGNIKAARLQSKAADAMTNQKEIDIRSEALQASDNFTRSLNEYKKAEQLYNSEFEEVFNGISENFQKRNISLLEFVDFIEAYNKSIAELQRVKTQLSIAAETINFVTAKEVY